jgi:hypothetical protein
MIILKWTIDGSDGGGVVMVVISYILYSIYLFFTNNRSPLPCFCEFYVY